MHRSHLFPFACTFINLTCCLSQWFLNCGPRSRSLLVMQILRPYTPILLSQKLGGGLGGRELESTHLYFNKSSRWFWRMLKFDIYCLKWTEIYQWNPQGHPPATSSSSSDLCAIHWSQPSAHCHCDHVVSPLRYMLVPIPTGRAYSSYLLVNAGRKGGRDEGHA